MIEKSKSLKRWKPLNESIGFVRVYKFKQLNEYMRTNLVLSNFIPPDSRNSSIFAQSQPRKGVSSQISPSFSQPA
jgi:hypothetical protein